MNTPQIEKPADPGQFLRWATKLVGQLNAWWKLGTNRIQGFFVPVPGASNDGQVLAFNASTGEFEYVTGAVGTITDVTATAPISSSGGTAPNITHDTAGTAGTKGSASKVPVFHTNATGHVDGNTDTDIAIDASQVTSGMLVVARGGTGVATTQANKVFAGPASGADAAPSFRVLTSADLPFTTSDNETPSGSITGTTGSDGNPNFSIAHSPLGEPQVVVTGLTKLLGTDYTRSGANFTFLAPQIPIAGNDWIRIWSRY